MSFMLTSRNKMRGNEPTLKDIELELEPLVLPANLLSDESLSPDSEGEEECLNPYRVVTSCTGCSCSIRFFVVSSRDCIRSLQQLLLTDLSFLCLNCSKGTRNGRK